MPKPSRPSPPKSGSRVHRFQGWSACGSSGLYSEFSQRPAAASVVASSSQPSVTLPASRRSSSSVDGSLAYGWGRGLRLLRPSWAASAGGGESAGGPVGEEGGSAGERGATDSGEAPCGGPWLASGSPSTAESTGASYLMVSGWAAWMRSGETRSPSGVLSEGGHQHFLRDRADNLVDLLAVLVDHEGGDGHDAVLHRGHLVLVGVELAELDARHLGGELLDDGADALAGATPGGPEVDEDDAGLPGELGEVRVGEGGDRSCHGNSYARDLQEGCGGGETPRDGAGP